MDDYFPHQFAYHNMSLATVLPEPMHKRPAYGQAAIVSRTPSVYLHGGLVPTFGTYHSRALSSPCAMTR
jgi:hypothetical protein